MSNNNESLVFELFLKASQVSAEMKKLEQGTDAYSLKLKELQNLLLSLNAIETGKTLSIKESELEVQRQITTEIEKQVRAEEELRAAYTNNFNQAQETSKESSMMANTAMFKDTGGYVGNISKGGGDMLFAPSTTDNINKVNKALGEIPANQEKVAKGFDVIRSAAGFLVASIMGQLINALMTFFRTAFEGFKKLRGDIAQLNFAESILSKKGMDITRKELDDFVTEVQTKFKYISKGDAMSIVSDVADIGTEFDLSKEKILGLSEAIAFIQTKEKLMGQEVSDSGSIINAALDARSNYFNKLGVNITKTLVAEKAYEMGLAKQGTELSKDVKMQAAIALLIEQTANKREELLKAIEETDPALAHEMEVNQKYADSALEVGKALAEMKDGFNQWVLSLDPKTIQTFITFIKVLVKAIEMLAVASAWGWKILMTLVGAISAVVASITTFIYVASKTGDIALAFKMAGQAAKDAFLAGWNMGGNPLALLMGTTEQKETDTPTGTKKTSKELLESDQKLKDALKKMNEDIMDAQNKLSQDMEDAAIDLGRKLVDIDTEYARKRADAQQDLAKKIRDININVDQKIADINVDSNRKIADINADAALKEKEESQKAKNDELQREAEFQNKMLEMREKFLMDLEDALHERDARAILRLIKEYNLSKAQALREHELDKNKAAQDQAQQATQRKVEVQQKIQQVNEDRARAIADAEIDRQRQISDAKRAFADKMAELDVEQARERSDAQQDYQRKLQDLQRATNARLETIKNGLMQEFNLTRQGLDAIYALYLQQARRVAATTASGGAGTGGSSTSTSSLSSAPTLSGGTTSSAYAAPSTTKPSGLMGTIGQLTASALDWTNRTFGKWNQWSTYGFAEGGNLLVDKPTRFTAGENFEPEMISVTPLSRIGKNVGKTFGGLSNKGGMGGDLSIQLVLSPDLEARIISNTLDQTANIFTKIVKGK